jgi:protein-S-isoprenylcysteine O-methyltransferase Ste14
MTLQALELKIPPLLLVAVFGLTMFGATRLVPTLSFAAPGSSVVAAVLAAVGAITVVAGVVAFRRQRTTVNPTTPGATSSVVSSGVYSWSRNPMYLGFLLILAGWAVYLSSAAALALLLAFVAYIQRFQIKPEERILLEKFGPEFAAYMKRVRRWV